MNRYNNRLIPQLGLVMVIVLVTMVPYNVLHAATERPSLLYGEIRPQQLISVAAPMVNVAGTTWWGTVDAALFTATLTPTPMVALTTVGSQLKATCPKPTTTVGVQFLGDGNDGWARVRVDGETHWQGNIQGSTLVYDTYVEVADLPLAIHTIQVETMPTPGTNALRHVTVVAFGCGTLTAVTPANRAVESNILVAEEQSASREEQPQSAHQLFLPAVRS